MTRFALTESIGSWSVAVVLATGCASFAMVTTAAVSVLTSDQVAAAEDLYGARICGRSGKRAVRAVDAQAGPVPFPDTCSVTYVPSFDTPLLEALQAVRCLLPTVRPLHEAIELPDNFI